MIAFRKNGTPLPSRRAKDTMEGPIMLASEVDVENNPMTEARFSFGYLSAMMSGGTEISTISRPAQIEYRNSISRD
jgi:hypothetical protein